MLEVLAWLLQVVYIANIAVGFSIVFFKKKNPGATWAWLMVIALVPYVGFLIYLAIGLEGSKHSVFSKKSKEDDKTFVEMRKMHDSLPKEEALKRIRNLFKLPGSIHLYDLVGLNYNLGNSELSTNNGITIYHEGVSKFSALFKDIKRAKKFIHIQYYIMNNDELGNKVVEALCEKAKEGVEVKLSIDAMGNFGMCKKFFSALKEAGGKVALFLPPAIIRLNYRNHRKICVIDGLVGYIGGMNIGDEYVSKKKRFGFWRDTHIRITGNAVKDLEARFICDWNFQSEYKITDYKSYLPDIPDNEYGVPIQIVSSGPDTTWPCVHYSYNKMIQEAETSVYIETPYFVPDDSILESLRIAALSGIDVRIVFPANPDHPFVYWASLSYIGDLLEAGVRCYKYEKGFIHSKVLIMDNAVTSVGTANMDFRSFKLNFEVNAVIFDEGISNAFAHQFKRDLDDCTEISLEWYKNRPGLTRIKESFSRLLSPLL